MNWQTQKHWRGFALGCGFPKQMLPGVLAKLERERVPLVLVCETGRELYKTKERLPSMMWEYPIHEQKEKASG
ncbi:hypothetical protein HUU05_08470 [candidate division KSB1 bacterium]|nr:hypothetical protein [candidate division KSB1 bacterium]